MKNSALVKMMRKCPQCRLLESSTYVLCHTPQTAVLSTQTHVCSGTPVESYCVCCWMSSIPSTLTKPGYHSFIESMQTGSCLDSTEVTLFYLSLGIILKCILYSPLSLNYPILPRLLHIILCFLDDSTHFDEPFDIIGLELSKYMFSLLL